MRHPFDRPTRVPIVRNGGPQIVVDDSTAQNDRQGPQRVPHALQRATLTVTEAAVVLGVSRSAAYDLVHEGRIPALRLGRRIVVPAHALDDLLHSVDDPT